LRHGDTVSNLRHRPIRLLDHIGQHLVQLLDGTRDRESLRAELERAVRNGQFAVYREGKPIAEMDDALKELDDHLDLNLTSLAQAALLVS
ncbi:MAG: SAM-dependent methyltransferase, partial [Verrucomicrobia bacterium]|nr:SAM-dependent methyltransferase [Verrucomicrobiota bacterium]